MNVVVCQFNLFCAFTRPTKTWYIPINPFLFPFPTADVLTTQDVNVENNSERLRYAISATKERNKKTTRKKTQKDV